MPSTATEHDHTTLRTVENWKITAAEEVEEIGGWRDANPDKLAAYWKDGCTALPSGPPQMPGMFYTKTTCLVGDITARYPKLDPAPLQDVYAAIAAWYADHNASRIPPQPVLFATLERAMMTLQAIEGDIQSRLLYEDDRDFPERLIRRAQESVAPLVLTPTELARLREHLNAPPLPSELQHKSAEQTRRRKLTEILSYNDELAKLPPSPAEARLAAEAGTTPPGPDGLIDANPQTDMPVRAVKAGNQYQQALNALDTNHATDREAYDLLCSTYEKSNEPNDLPAFPSWQRNLREFRRRTNRQKNTPRRGRCLNKSIIRESDR